MPPFERDAMAHPSQLDFLLASFGPVHLFWNPAILSQTRHWLAENGYDLVLVDSAGWIDEAGMHASLASAMNFPGYYGRNMNALDECLGDVASYWYGTTPSATGFALVIEHYEAFAQADAWAAQRLLHSFARAAHGGALIGHRMLCLVQSDDPRIAFEPVGAARVSWNPQEFLDSSRGL